MTLTDRYSALHRALVDVARRRDLAPMDIRVLVALHERGGAATSEEIEQDLLCEGSAVRRSWLVLRESSYVFTSGIDGGRARQGVRTQLTLTAIGRGLAEQAIAAATTNAEEAEAA